MVAISAVLLSCAAVLGLVWMRGQSDQDTNFSDAKKLTTQIIEVADGAEDAVNSFGGHIKRKKSDGHRVIVIDKVPPRVCAASGWELQHKGILTVNGVTPKRISSAIITEMCYNGGGDVTISWEPREAKSVASD